MNAMESGPAAVAVRFVEERFAVVASLVGPGVVDEVLEGGRQLALGRYPSTGVGLVRDGEEASILAVHFPH